MIPGLACLRLMAGSARQAAQRAHGGTAICTTSGLLPSPKGKAGDLGSFLPLEIVPLPSWLIQQ